MSNMRASAVLAAVGILAIVFSPAVGPEGAASVDAVASLDAVLSVKSAVVAIGTSVRFFGESSGGVLPLSFGWSFRDGSTSSERNPVHVYWRPGTFEVALVVQDGSGRMDLDRLSVRVREPLPGVDFPGADAGPDRIAWEDQALGFDASVTWPGADPSSLVFAWDFGDGTPVAYGNMVAHAFENGGSYRVGLTVTNPATGSFDVDEAVATVLNVDPVADAGLESIAGFEDDVFSFDATASIDTPSDRAGLAYAWDFGDGQRGAGPSTRHSYARAGTYAVGLTVTDDNGVSSGDAVVVHIANAVPHADTGQIGFVAEGDPAHLDGRGSEDTPSDRPFLRYEWTADSTLPSRAGWGPAFTWPDEGLHPVRLVVTDDDGAIAAAIVSVPVANVPPRVGITGIWWFQDDLLLEGYAFDPGADDLVFEWSVDGTPWYRSLFASGGVRPREVYGYSLNPPRNALASSWEIALTVSDGDGGVGQDSVTIVLARSTGSPRPQCAVPPALAPECPLPPRDAWSVDNLAPRVDVTDSGPDPPEELTVFFESAFVEDPDSKDLTYRWEFGNGVTVGGASVLHGFQNSGTYTAVLTVEDDEGDRTSNARLVTVTNLDPVATFSPTESPREDEPFTTWGGDSSDTASDKAELIYAWKFSDGEVAEGLHVPHAFTRDGTASIVLTVIDDDGASSETRADLDVANVAPLAVASGPASAVEGRAITLSAEASIDTPSDRPLLTHEWTQDAHPIAGGRNPVVASMGEGLVTFLLRVRDDRGADSVATVEVLVANSAPGVYAGPDLFVYGPAQGIVFEGRAADLADSSALDSVWTFSDGGTAAGLIVTHSFSASGIYSACLEVSDGTDTSEDCATVEVSLDTDGDNLLDEAERGLGTDPSNFDTDGDFLTDYQEYIATHTDPTREDTDDDRLNDWEELYLGDDGYVTNPFNPDTDGDQLSDGDEVNLVRTATFVGRDEAYLAGDLGAASYYVERIDLSSSARETATFDLGSATREYHNVTGRVEYQTPCFPFPCLVEYRTDARFRWTNLSVDLLEAGFTRSDFSRPAFWTFGHADRLSSVVVRVGSDRIVDAQAFLSFSNVEYSEIHDLLGLDFITFRDNAFYASEFRVTVRAKTSPVVADGDLDGLADGDEVGGWVAFTIDDIDALERFEEAIAGGANAETILEAFTVRAVSSTPIASDADWDGRQDYGERTLGLDPNNPDSDSDGELDGIDPDPSVVDPYGPSIVLIDQLIEFGIIDLKTYHLTFRICDPKGVAAVQSSKNAYMLRIYELPRSKLCLDYYTRFAIGIGEVFTGADFFVLAVDATGSLNAVSLRQPTLLADVLDGIMQELTKSFAGPVAGGIFSGMYWALRDSLVDMVDLIFNFPQVLAALAKVGEAFGRDPTGTMWEMLIQILQYLESEQNASNPYPEESSDREQYRFFWYQGYVAGSVLLAATGSAIAKAAFKPLRFRHAFVADDILDAGTDAGSLTKKVGLWAKFRPSTRFMLVAGSFTAAFAVASYVWPEVFQGVFSRFTSVAFPAFVLGSLVNPGGPGGPTPPRRAIVLFDGYVGGGVPGPSFFHRTVGLGAKDAVLASADMAGKVWKYIRGAQDVDVFDLSRGELRVHRFMQTEAKILAGLDAPDGTRLPNVVALLEGDESLGWTHIRNRHILGTDSSGSGRLTLFPPDLSDDTIKSIIQETLARGTVTPDDIFAVNLNFHGRHGISNMRVVFDPSGRIITAFPIDGPRVIIVRAG